MAERQRWRRTNTPKLPSDTRHARWGAAHALPVDRRRARDRRVGDLFRQRELAAPRRREPGIGTAFQRPGSAALYLAITAYAEASAAGADDRRGIQCLERGHSPREPRDCGKSR